MPTHKPIPGRKCIRLRTRPNSNQENNRSHCVCLQTFTCSGFLYWQLRYRTLNNFQIHGLLQQALSIAWNMINFRRCESSICNGMFQYFMLCYFWNCELNWCGVVHDAASIARRASLDCMLHWLIEFVIFTSPNSIFPMYAVCVCKLAVGLFAWLHGCLLCLRPHLSLFACCVFCLLCLPSLLVLLITLLVFFAVLVWLCLFWSHACSALLPPLCTKKCKLQFRKLLAAMNVLLPGCILPACHECLQHFPHTHTPGKMHGIYNCETFALVTLWVWLKTHTAPCAWKPNRFLNSHWASLWEANVRSLRELYAIHLCNICKQSLWPVIAWSPCMQSI